MAIIQIVGQIGATSFAELAELYFRIVHQLLPSNESNKIVDIVLSNMVSKIQIKLLSVHKGNPLKVLK